MVNDAPIPTDSARDVDVVLVGASAGGLEALGQLLPPLSVDLRVPVVIVVHLPKNHRSMLPDLFAARCQTPVREPLDKQPLVPGAIWFAPADYHLLIARDRRFALSIDPPVHFSRPSVDVLFESGADVFGARAAAVVLSGASEDGAEGARSVRRAGGVVLVQDPDSALARIMPEACIRHADPQYIGLATTLAQELRHLTGASS